MNTTIRILLLCPGIAFWAVSCRKLPDYPLRSSIQKTDSAGTIAQALDSSACHLFDQAFHRSGLDSSLVPPSEYTIFAPTDSAMTAAGFTASVIAGLSPDSLARLVKYHIVSGAYTDATLSEALFNVQANSIRQDISVDTVVGDLIYQQNLYLAEENGMVYINGEARGTGVPAVAAYNGDLFTIRQVLQAPGQSLWNLIAADPRLTLFYAALQIDDSLMVAFQAGDYYQHLCDSVLLSNIIYTNGNNQGIVQNLPTVLAPTNAAFQAAGFNTVADLRNFALRSPMSEGGVMPNNNFYYLNDNPLDSILYAHFLYVNTSVNASALLLLYNDFLFSPGINNGILNTDVYQPLSRNTYAEYLQPYPLTFSNRGGEAYVQWNPAVPPAPIPPETPPSQPPTHYLAENGALYIVDQLFTSPN